MSGLTSEIKALGKALGVSKIGIADMTADAFAQEKGFKTAISIAVRLSDGVLDEVQNENTPTFSYFHQYRTANGFIDQVLFRIGLELQSKGYRILQIAGSQSVPQNGNGYQGVYSHRKAATLAGMGWIGKSNALVTPEFGPRVRLGTLFTDAPLEADCPIVKPLCGSCKACVQACPALALTGEKWFPGKERSEIVDVKTCSEYMHSAYQHIGRGVVCGLCIAVCPVGKERNDKK